MSQVANLRILLKTALPIGKEKKKKKSFFYEVAFVIWLYFLIKD